jgi:hypothetical protein
MSTPFDFTAACERLDELVATTTLPTAGHRLETGLDGIDYDPGVPRVHFTPDQITLRQVETALLILTTEMKKRQPNWDAAFDIADRALNLIGLIRIEDAAAQRAAGVNHGN